MLLDLCKIKPLSQEYADCEVTQTTRPLFREIGAWNSPKGVRMWFDSVGHSNSFDRAFQVSMENSMKTDDISFDGLEARLEELALRIA